MMSVSQRNPWHDKSVILEIFHASQFYQRCAYAKKAQLQETFIAMHWLFGHNFGGVIGKRETEKCPNEMTVIKPKGSFSIQWRVVGWGYLWTSCKPYIQWVALKTRGGGCLSRCPNSSVFSVVSAQPIHPAKCLSIMRLLHIVTCVVCMGEKDVCVMKSVWNRSRERLRLDP